MSNQTIKYLHVKDYNSALTYLGSKSERPCGHNTRIRLDETGVIYIRYHSTNIITYHPDGFINLDNDGYFTSTTKERYNAFLPDEISVYQERGRWLIVNRELQLREYWKNGMFITPERKFMGTAEPEDADRVKELTKKIKVYAKEFTEALIRREIEQPSGGDCWYCCMKTEDGKSLGDVVRHDDHLLSHLEEMYFVPSLLINVVEGRGMSQFDKYIIGNLLGYIDSELSEWEIGMIRRNLPKQIANYFKDRLDIAR